MNTALFVGLVSVTVGGLLLTIIFTRADVFVAPRLSVATAWSTCGPLATFVHVRVSGLFVLSPNFTLSANKANRVTVPSASVAVEVIEILVGAKNPLPFVGVVI